VILLKKNIAIVLVVGLLVLGGAGYWYYTSHGGGFVGSLADALNLGRAMKCTAEIEGSESTFYIKGGKLRGGAAYEGQQVEYIFRDNCFYYWSEEESQGMKMCWDEEEAADWEENLAAASEQWDCKPASISDSMFNVPSDIEFFDLSDYMQQYMTE
jgi:hypothetical protein